MTWQPGKPVLTTDDEREWQAWRKARAAAAQRHRRASLRRIDYHPSEESAAIIDAIAGRRIGCDYSSVINRLIEAAEVLPE